NCRATRMHARVARSIRAKACQGRSHARNALSDKHLRAPATFTTGCDKTAGRSNVQVRASASALARELRALLQREQQAACDDHHHAERGPAIGQLREKR